jgi:BlaI family transcriptional regulator, penicillinase repressor
MAKTPTISDAEWQVMRVVWERPSPITASDVVDELSRTTDWSAATVKTMLNRLVKKGALTYEAQGKRYLYRPKVKQAECVRSESRSFLQRVFGGAAAPMLNHFVRDAHLTPDEVAELKRILSQKEKRP